MIADIRAGLRMPGDGLALMQHPAIKREDSSMSNKRIRVSWSLINWLLKWLYTTISPCVFIDVRLTMAFVFAGSNDPPNDQLKKRLIG